ncbi:glycoside hydrolase family 5 protein [Tenacibaculum ovolyticum]|uniref:glycoside hydrolase family 5 protein n=1 Tax=Tenacibaculum ovolyticum TaxID=104270 RepID=UPI001F21CFF7|nr:cellulase family glycosylhydrolase [Tenacibaculum ovolyticum]
MKVNLRLLAILLLLLSCVKEKKTNDQKLHRKDNSSLISYWNKQRKGTNYFNKTPAKEWFNAVKQANIKFVRLTYEKWKGEQRDFLLGNADDYKGIIESDFKKLKYFLDYANEQNIKIVLTPLSLPGARYSQTNNNIRDYRLWKDSKYRKQASKFWKDLAFRLKDHPAIVGYNLINEPYPELAYKKNTFWDKGFTKWYENVKGGAGDLNLFNKKITEAIRSVNQNIPIIIESGLYGTPWAFEYLKPLKDDNIIYSFHMYEPYSFTTKKINQGRFSYPSSMYIEDLNKNFQLNKEGLNNFLTPIIKWSKKNKIPSNRIWVGEFGCNRNINGAEEYLQDLISIFNKNKWHWSFYAYREDVWEAMDYELGVGKVFYKYWEYQDSGNLYLNYDNVYKKMRNNTLWSVFKTEFK